MKHPGWRLLVFSTSSLLACSGDPSLIEIPDASPPVTTQDAGTSPAKDAGDAPDPSFTILSPIDGTLIGEEEVEVRGTAIDLNEVVIEGAAVPVIEGEFSRVVALEGEGPHTVIVFGAGAGEQQVEVLVDLSPPDLSIVDPPRGAFIDTNGLDKIRVTGHVSDAVAGATTLTVNGRQIPVSGETFTVEIDAIPGLNVIEAVALDAVGHQSDVIQSAIYGEFLPWSEPAPDALSIGLDDRVFGVLETGLEQGLISGLTSTAAVQGGNGVTVTGMSISGADVTITPRTGFLEIAISVEMLQIDFDLDTVVLGVPVQGPGVIAAERVDLETEAHVGIDPQTGEVAGQFEDSAASLVGFTLTVQGVAPWLTQALADIVRPQLEAGFVEQLEQQDLASLFDFSQFLPDDVNARISGLEIEPTGLTIIADAGLDLPQDAETPVAPGVIVTRSAPPTGAPANAMIRTSVADDLLNNVLFNTWKNGALTSSIAAPPPKEGMGFTLDAATLALFFGDELFDYAPAEAPVAVYVRPLLPPVARFDDTGRPRIDVGLGDALLDFVVEPEGETPIRFATFAAVLELETEVEIVGDQLATRSTFDFRIDLADAPLFPIDEDGVEELIGDLLLAYGAGGFLGQSLSPLDPAGLSNPGLAVEGDYLSITGDL